MSFNEKKQAKQLDGSLPVPTSAASSAPPKSRAHRFVPTLAFLALVGTYHLLPASSSALSLSSMSTKNDGFLSGPVGTEAHACSQASVAQVPKGHENRGDVFYSPEFGKKEVEQFLGALRIRTEIVSSLTDSCLINGARMLTRPSHLSGMT